MDAEVMSRVHGSDKLPGASYSGWLISRVLVSNGLIPPEGFGENMGINQVLLQPVQLGHRRKEVFLFQLHF